MVLELKDVCMRFCTKEGNLQVLDKVNFSIREGEIVALVGPSGSGKTTALNIIAGLLEPSSGEVIARGDIGYMFQRDNLRSGAQYIKMLLSV